MKMFRIKKQTTLDKNNFVALRIVYDEATEQTRDPSAVDYDFEPSEQLTDSEIDRKVHDCHNLSSKEKLIFVDLLRITEASSVKNRVCLLPIRTN